jgi:hypothetical protein
MTAARSSWVVAWACQRLSASYVKGHLKLISGGLET